MSPELIAMIVITSALSFGILFFRVPAFAILFSLLVGQVLSVQASGDVYGFIADLSNLPQYEYVRIGLLVLPAILTFVFLKGRAAKSGLMLELLPAIFSSVTLLLLLYPNVPYVKNMLDIATNDQIEGYRSASLIIASVLGLVSVWISYPKPSHKGDKHEK